MIVSSGKSRVNPFGGRIAGGIGYYYRDQVMLVAETGWNYFGDASRTSHGDRNYNVSGILVGADLLLGLDYLYNEHIALFGRAGTLLEQVIYSASSPNARGTINGTSLNVSGSMSGAQTNILPELKIGVLYRYTDAWGMSFAYMHAFGGNPALNGTFITSGSRTSSVTGQINTRNPSINSFLLGLKYSFC
ncbi:hypothetical protein [Legionella oakridgensis]|uniref:hypothetical protein n=1 Tax=Legionella oakridgensis TaxID=29423 RepID=UPI0003DDFD6C|nr:hypothetical protein [Legionella oakridgensis]ETO93814.1 OmpA-like transmembrane domain protein [Legionella oakridgensis RV-2-2007]